jgi:hypothetical protein
MPDELDPQLLRLFAAANEPLSDADFHARVMARVQRPSGWRGIAQATASTLFAISSGVAAGVPHRSDDAPESSACSRSDSARS